MNSLFNQLNSNANTGINLNSLNPQIINQARQIMGNMNEVNKLMGIISSKGLNAEQAVRGMCERYGIDVNQFISTIQGK